ncbi:hypothetical protein P0I91_000064 [Vibrio fluvialis]|nr:hypothetical protein [Vibrio fluvialis]
MNLSHNAYASLKGGLNGSASEAQRWGDVYTQLIQNKLTNHELYKGSTCSANVRLHPCGSVRRVVILTAPTNVKKAMNDLLCNEVFLAVYRVKQFPMPKHSSVKERLQNLNLTIYQE